jgi:hypothetical protein
LAASRGSLFGAPPTLMHAAAYLLPGTGQRSLATVQAPAGGIRFSGRWRAGAPEPDVQVQIDVAGLGDRFLPVKDHHLLCRAARAGTGLEGQLRTLQGLVAAMGDLHGVPTSMGCSSPSA